MLESSRHGDALAKPITKTKLRHFDGCSTSTRSPPLSLTSTLRSSPSPTFCSCVGSTPPATPSCLRDDYGGSCASRHVEALLKQSEFGDVATRESAADSLADLGGVGLEQLERMLKYTDMPTRKTIVDAMMRMGASGAAALGRRLGDDGDMWLLAAMALSRMGDDGMTALARCLGDGGVAGTRAEWALVSMGTGGDEALGRSFGHERSNVRAQVKAAEGLTRSGERAGGAHANTLASRLFDVDPSVQHAAAKALSTMGGIGAAVLARELPRGTAGTRKMMANSLGTMGDVVLPHAQALCMQTGDANPSVRARSLAALEHMSDIAFPPHQHFRPSWKVDPARRKYPVQGSQDPRFDDASGVRTASGSVNVIGSNGLRETALREWDLASCVEADGIAMRLRVGEPCDRANAVEALGQLGDVATKQLAMCLGDSEERVRDVAANYLCQLGRGAIIELVACLVDRSEMLRKAAAQALTQIYEDESIKGNPGEVERGDHDLYVSKRIGAIFSQLRLGDEAVACRSDLVNYLLDMGVSTTSPFVSVIAARLEEEHAEVRRRAAEALGQLGELASESVVALTKHLRDRDAAVRRTVTWAIAQTGRCVELQLPVLVRQLLDAEPSVREMAAFVLGKVGKEASSFAAALAARMLDDDAIVARVAAKSLRQMGPPGASALADLLKRDDISLRIRVADALGLMGPEAASAVTELARLVEDPCESNDAAAVRRHCAAAIGRLGVVAATGYAARCAYVLAGCDIVARHRAAEAFGELGEFAAPHAIALATALEDVDLAVRQAASKSLARMGGRSAIEALEEQMRNPNHAVRRRAISALREIGATQ
eukprot:TRINITY_DN62086_c0_g1_i1.p1 TRINITY_DN62086_c0_g1~~TRINITY_DN62086_c0_g1_i1.p1  ORF type:complete len:832 (-),score=126.42 TRINITY_DN62086_c0_g1_i1:117-2612(-)